MGELVRLEVEGGVGTVRLDRPKMNVLDSRLVGELRAATVEAAIDGLDARWPGMRDRVCDSRPSIRRHINVFVDGEPGGEETAVGAEDRVDVLPAISGGARG